MVKESVIFIRYQMTEFIQEEVAKSLNLLQRHIRAFEIPASGFKEICRLVLQLDAIAQFLPGYIEIQEINENIKKAIDSVSMVLDDAFKSINEYSEKFLYDQAIKRLYRIQMLIKYMQAFYTDSSQVDSLPSKRNSMEDFFAQMQAVIKERKLHVNSQLGKTLSDYYQAIITNGKAQL